MGAIGGFLWHFVKGARNSPQGDRLQTALYNARNRAPILGGNFAVWGGTFSSFDCTLQYIRRRDDHWNAIASGFLTGGVLASRAGGSAASSCGPPRRRPATGRWNTWSRRSGWRTTRRGKKQVRSVALTVGLITARPWGPYRRLGPRRPSARRRPPRSG